MDSSSNPILELDHNKIWSEIDEDNRDIRAEIGVFRGSMSFSIFNNKTRGAPIFKFSIPLQFAEHIKTFFNYLKKEGPSSNISTQILEKDEATQKMASIGSITLGNDKTNRPYVGIQWADNRHKFTLRPPYRYDFSANNLPPQLIKDALIDSFVNAITNSTIAMRMSSTKRTGGPQDRSQSTGRGGYGNRSNYNNNNNNNQASNKPASSDNDSVPF